MSRATRVSEDSISTELEQLEFWSLQDGKLHKEFQFSDFVAAFGWMSQVALVAERMGHHPEWFNVYNRVTVDLVTHDVNGISNLDFELASKMDELAAS